MLQRSKLRMDGASSKLDAQAGEKDLVLLGRPSCNLEYELFQTCNSLPASILQSQSGVPKVFWLGKQSASREAEMEEQGRLMALVCIIMRNPSISCSVRLHLYNGKLAIAVGHVAVFLQESGLEQTDETPIHLDWVNMVCRLLAAFGVSCLSGHFRCEGMLAPKFDIESL